MSRTRPHRPPFDARHTFVVTPPAGRTNLSVGGKLLPAGEVLEPGLVDARRLRQMYESRLIAVAPGSRLEARAPKPRAIGPVSTELDPPAARAAAKPRRKSLKRAA